MKRHKVYIGRKKLRSGLTQQEELFAKNFVRHGDKKIAYKEAGYSNSDDKVGWEADLLLKKDHIIDRIDVLRAQSSVRLDMDIDQYHKKILDTYDAAMSAGDYSAANKSLEIVGKSMGFIVERKESKNMNLRMDLKGEEVKDRVTQLLKMAGLDEPKS